MTPIVLPVGSLIKFNSAALSEHNRSPMSIGYNRIEKTQRMANGTLRKFFIADKKTFNVSWEQLPSYSNYTVDGGYGALDLKTFYEGTLGKSSFPVTISYGPIIDGTTETRNMIFTSFSCEVTKRNVYSEVIQKVSNITAVTHNGSSLTYTGSNSFTVGDAVSVSGLDTDLYNVSNAAVTAASSTSFTVAKAGSQASVTEASSDGAKFTYYASNSFAAGDVVSVSGFNTKTITAASSASGNITYTSTAHGFLVGDTVNISGVNVAAVAVSPYNLSNATIASKDDNTFTIVGTATGTPVFSSAQATSVYNKTNVDILAAADYYFTVSDTSSPATVVLATPGTASLYSESTQFSVTAFTPTAGTNVIYTSVAHDLEVGDKVSITGIRSTATITNAEKLTGDNVISHSGTITSVQLTDNVATVYFSDASFSTYQWNIGDSITISGCSNSAFNGTHTVTAVPANSAVSFAKTNTTIPLDEDATGSAVNNTWSGGMTKYTASNSFVKNDIISITGITPTDYNNASARIAHATSTYFLVPGSITTKYRKSGSASSIFNLSNVTISAVTKDTFTVPFTSATGSKVTVLSNVKASKQVNYTASASTTSKPQEFWSVSLSLEEV
jgi:hypothetical protein